MTDYLFVTSAVAPWGAETSLTHIVNGLKEEGHSPAVLTNSPPVAAFVEQRTGARVVLTTISSTSPVARLRAFRRQILSAAPGGARVVLFSADLYPLAVSFILSRRYVAVLDVHDSFEGLWALAKLRISCFAARRTIAISEFVRAQLGRRRRVSIVSRPIEIPERASNEASASLDEVGIVGRIVGEKRIDIAIAAVAQVEGVRLHIYGDTFAGSEQLAAELVKLAERHAPGRVIFHGRKEPTEIYSSIGILVVANDREASGRTVGEAMAHRLVVIVPSEGGANEYIKDGASGYSWDSQGGASALAAKIRDATADPVRSREIGERARIAVAATRTVAVVARSYDSAITPARMKHRWQS